MSVHASDRKPSPLRSSFVVAIAVLIGLVGCSRGPSWTEEERHAAHEFAAKASEGVGQVTEVIFRDAPGYGSTAAGADVVITMRARGREPAIRRRLFANLSSLGLPMDQTNCLRLRDRMACDDGGLAVTVEGAQVTVGILLVRFQRRESSITAPRAG